MILREPIIGKFINMRSVEEEDASFILKLRLDENNIKFVGETENNIEKQVVWIKQQKIRLNDYYFMITDKENNRIGVISVYNIDGKKSESGRFISFGDSIQNMEAVIMHHDFAYYKLSIDLVHFTVYKHNKMVANMWKRLGADIVSEMKINGIDSYYYEMTKDKYEKVFRPKVLKTLQKCN